jgi:hypothetical protein
MLNVVYHNVNGRYHFRDLSINGRIILKWILRSQIWGCELDSSGSGQGTVECSCEQSFRFHKMRGILPV